ncbi:MAG: hypothetical protein MZW92_52035 [Comamonadaceae bacterium]|nr:hypothetical protein [Comamonadaceae bacterium]
MADLDTSTESELVSPLSPRLADETDRTTLLDLALGTGRPELAKIGVDRRPGASILKLVAELVRIGEIEPGKQALWKLLETVRDKVSADLQARIDALEPVVNRLSERAKQVAVPTITTALGAPTHLRVFLASPGDVTHERGSGWSGARDRSPTTPCCADNATIEAVAWDKPGASVRRCWRR